MPPIAVIPVMKRHIPPTRPTKDKLDKDASILEAWIEGVQLGSLMILMLITFCNSMALSRPDFLFLLQGTFLPLTTKASSQAQSAPSQADID